MPSNVIDIKVRMDSRGMISEFRRIEKSSEASAAKTGSAWSNALSGIGPLWTSAIVAAVAGGPAILAAGGAAAGIAFGAALLIGTKKTKGPLYKSFHDMLHGLLPIARAAATPLIAPLKLAFASFGTFAKQMAPVLKGIFSAIAPAVAPLVSGLESLIKGLLPGFLTLMKQSAPAMQAFGSLLGSIGKGVGGFLAALAPAVKTSAGFFSMLGSIIANLLPPLGGLIAALSGALGPAMKIIGIVAQTVGGELKQLNPVFKALADLVGAVLTGLAPLVRLMGHVMVQAFRVLADALTPVIQVLTMMVQSLLPPVIGWLNKMAGSFDKAAAKIRDAAIKAAVLGFISGLLGYMKGFLQIAKQTADGVMNFVADVLLALSLIPGNHWARDALNQLDGFKKGADNAFNGAIKKIGEWQTAVTHMQTKITLQDNFDQVSGQVRKLQGQLTDPNLTKTRRAQIQLQLGNDFQRLAALQLALDAIHSKNVYITTIPVGGGNRIRASGGLVGAASGGLRSNMTMVGEHGRELVSLPTGSMVHSNPDTERMISQGGGGQRVVIEFRGGSGMTGLDALFWTWLQSSVRVKGGDPVMFQKKVAFA